MSAIADARPATTDLSRRVLAVTCGAHALHDGFTDLIYVLLPVWQAEFALSYAALGAAPHAVHRRDGEPAGADGGSGAARRRTAAARRRHGAGRRRLPHHRTDRRRVCRAGSGADRGRHRRRRAASDRVDAGVARLRRSRLAHRSGHLQFRRRSREDGGAGSDRVAAGADAVATGVGADRPARHRGAIAILLALPARLDAAPEPGTHKPRAAASPAQPASASAVSAAAEHRRARQRARAWGSSPSCRSCCRRRVRRRPPSALR